ncbi:MAG: hypothetical protein Q9163_002663 [Psora crenata]
MDDDRLLDNDLFEIAGPVSAPQRSKMASFTEGWNEVAVPGDSCSLVPATHVEPSPVDALTDWTSWQSAPVPRNTGTNALSQSYYENFDTPPEGKAHNGLENDCADGSARGPHYRITQAVDAERPTHSLLPKRRIDHIRERRQAIILSAKLNSYGATPNPRSHAQRYTDESLTVGGPRRRIDVQREQKACPRARSATTAAQKRNKPLLQQKPRRTARTYPRKRAVDLHDPNNYQSNKLVIYRIYELYIKSYNKDTIVNSRQDNRKEYQEEARRMAKAEANEEAGTAEKQLELSILKQELKDELRGEVEAGIRAALEQQQTKCLYAWMTFSVASMLPPPLTEAKIAATVFTAVSTSVASVLPSRGKRQGDKAPERAFQRNLSDEGLEASFE